jgi:metal-responsive CopG/Arc/MetJ family transcriptional regulator
MKDKRIYVRVTEEFLKKLEYLKEINGFKNLSETIRKIVEKEYRKEKRNG